MVSGPVFESGAAGRGVADGLTLVARLVAVDETPAVPDHAGSAGAGADRQGLVRREPIAHDRQRLAAAARRLRLAQTAAPEAEAARRALSSCLRADSTGRLAGRLDRRRQPLAQAAAAPGSIG